MFHGPGKALHRLHGMRAGKIVAIARRGPDQQAMQDPIMQGHQQMTAKGIDCRLDAIDGIGKGKARAEKVIDQIVFQKTGVGENGW